MLYEVVLFSGILGPIIVTRRVVGVNIAFARIGPRYSLLRNLPTDPGEYISMGEGI
jgi:hypothetical protein